MKTEVLPAKKDERTQAMERIQALEDRLFGEAMEIVSDINRFREIDPSAEEPPESWVREVGLRKAQMRLRVAKAAWMSARDAPVALKTVTQLAVGILKVKSAERTAGSGKTFNAVVVNLVNEPMPAYPKQEVDR